MRSQSWQLFTPGSEIKLDYIVKNHDLINWKLNISVVNSPIFPNSFATVEVHHYMNCHSLLRVARLLY